uniref:Uncharacterized protein n=1 Tax=Neogobius melanostomus TaxID=47308 RepID=A0A8C6WGU6_9GOBI
MASRPASPTTTSSLEKQLSCSICLETFRDPVTTSCGHSFCKECLTRCLRLQNESCPLCKKLLNRAPEVNIVLRNVVGQVKKQKEEENERRERERKKKEEEEEAKRFRGKPGQVPCDVCPKMAATKSCLVCLTSYCEEHLRNHSTNERFKGHKLVDPVEDLDQRACLTHGRPLELYSRTEQRCICVRCMEEGDEGVVSMEDEWASKKAKLDRTVKELKEKVTERMTKMDEIDAAFKSCKDQLDAEWWDIEAVFNGIIAVVEAAQARALSPVEQRRKRLENEAEELSKLLQAEADALETTISELNHISAFEDHILFLQKYPSLKEPSDTKDWAAVELDTSLCFGSMRKVTTTMARQIQEETEKLTAIELQRFPKFAEDVTLDPNTSHTRLVLSKNRKEVFDGEENQEFDDDLERFDIFGSILGSEALGSGRAYWEVQVGGKSGWDLGVTSATAKRKGKLTLSPDNGYWAIVHYEGEKYAALTAPPVCLQLEEKPETVGVFVDYEEGLVSFYNVTNREHIYSFDAAVFGDEILPYFSPHVKDERNTEPLIISPVKTSCSI